MQILMCVISITFLLYFLFWNTKEKRDYLMTRFLLEICKINDINYSYKKGGFEIFYKTEKILDLEKDTGLRKIIVKKNENFNNLSELVKDKIDASLFILDKYKLKNIRLNIK